MNAGIRRPIIFIISILLATACHILENDQSPEGDESPEEDQALNTLPDTLWTRTFGGSEDDKAYFVQQTSDGGFIITGSTESESRFGGSGTLLIKVDASGNEEWSRTYGGKGNNEGYCVRETRDGGFIVAGGSIHLLKTNPMGEEQWTRIFDDYGDVGRSVQQTTDGGFIITGCGHDYENHGQAWLIKTDINGVEQWRRTYGGGGGGGYRWGYSVQQTTDGGYIVTGSTYLRDYNEDGCSWLLKSNSSGNTEWTQTFGGIWNEVAYSVQQTIDAGYIVAGAASEGSSQGYTDIRLTRFNTDGSLQWSRTYGEHSNWDVGYCVELTDDDGFILVGQTQSYGAILGDVWLIKTGGEKEWDQIFGGSGTDIGYSVQQTIDGGYIVVGTTTSFGAGGYDIWLIRVAPEPDTD